MLQFLGVTILCVCFSGVFCVGEYDKYGTYPAGAPDPARPPPLILNGRGAGPGAPRAPIPVVSGFDGAIDYCVSTEQDPDADCIPGQAVADYPVYDQVPATGFSCQGTPYPGYYADPEAQCQVFHICQQDGRQDSFLCPKGTVFNQQYFVCDWWYNFDCGRATSMYGLNAELYIEPPRSPYAVSGYQQPRGPYPTTAGAPPGAPYPATAPHPAAPYPGNGAPLGGPYPANAAPLRGPYPANGALPPTNGAVLPVNGALAPAKAAKAPGY